MEMTNNVKEILDNLKKENKKAVVLSSGGLDSLVVLKYAIERFGKENVYTLDTYYGQNHEIEMACSKRISEHFGVKRTLIDISDVFKFSDSAMLKKNGDKIIHKSYEEQIYGEEGTEERQCVNTYCPNRNAILINVAGAFALSIGAEYVLIGAHADDGAGFAYKDCRPEFIEASAKALEEGTDPTVHLIAPLINLSKSENVLLGKSLGLSAEEFALSWSCYDPVEVSPGIYKECHSCGTCQDKYRALESNNIKIDPNLTYSF